MKFTRYILITIIWFATIHEIAAQVDTAGVVFVSNDYREASSNTVIVKWVANKVYYQKGFDVYRRQGGETSWSKLNEAPINVKDKVPTYLRAQDPDTEKLLEYVNTMKYEEFQKNLIRVFVAIKAVESPGFAEALGVIYYDKSAKNGVSYEYKVVGNTATSTKETIHVSPKIICGSYEPKASPKNITTERKRKQINLNWEVENERYYGVVIYRKSSAEQEYVKITKQVLSVQKAANQKGELTYPKIFFEDKDINKDETYSYKLVPIDYFGQEGVMSKPISMAVIDFDAPLPAYNVKADARLLGVQLTWEIQTVPDLVGLNVYRYQHAGDELDKRNATILAISDTAFYEEVARAGGYYYTIGAIDTAGNEALSQEIFIDVHDLIPPAIPQNVRVISDTGKVMLTWEPVTDEDLWGYFVHRSLNDDNNDDNEFIVVNKEPIIENQYLELFPAKVKNKFVYKVVAVDSSYNRSAHSSLSVVQLPDVTPPDAPFLKNIHTDHSTIKLQWLAYHEDDLLGFNVYRSSANDSSNYVKINKELIPADRDSYVDEMTIAGDLHYYYVTAIDQSGNISKPSGVFKGMSDASEGGTENAHHDELKVTSLKIKYVKKKKITKFVWQNPVLEDFIGVVVYKGSSENSLRPISGKLKGTVFVDKEIETGTTYYQIRSYDSHGHKSLSEIVKVTVGK